MGERLPGRCRSPPPSTPHTQPPSWRPRQVAVARKNKRPGRPRPRPKVAAVRRAAAVPGGGPAASSRCRWPEGHRWAPALAPAAIASAPWVAATSRHCLPATDPAPPSYSVHASSVAAPAPRRSHSSSRHSFPVALSVRRRRQPAIAAPPGAAGPRLRRGAPSDPAAGGGAQPLLACGLRRTSNPDWSVEAVQ